VLRVLQVAESGTGGVPAFINRVCGGLSGEISFGVACPETSDLASCGMDGVTVYPVPMAHSLHPIRDYRAAARIREVVDRERYDVVHLNSTKAGIIGVPLKRGLKAKTVFTPHALRSHAYPDGSLKRRAALFIEKRVCAAADVIVACSAAEADDIVATGLAPSRKVRVVDNGVDLDLLQAPPAISRADIGIPDGAFVVGTIGRLSPQKDPATFVRAANLIASAVPEAHFVTAGDGPLLAEVRERVGESGIADRFHVLGWRDDALDVLKLLDVFLITSRYEGGSFAILEAAGARRPIVACDSPGVGPLLDDGVTALVAPQGDAEGIAQAVLSLRRNATMAQGLAAKAFDVIAWPRRLEVMVEAWGALYRSVSDGASGAQTAQPAQQRPA
jgi:glycosyltransferase involved in cell wall biosynthesis